MNYSNLKKFFIEISDIVYKERLFLLSFIAIFSLYLGFQYYYTTHQSSAVDFEVIEAPKSDYYYKKQGETTETSNSFNRDNSSIGTQKLFTFDPNTVSHTELISLGFSEKVANIFLNYRNKGGRFYKKEDVQKIFGVSERLYQSLVPFISIQEQNKSTYSKFPPSKNPQTIDINTASIKDWESLPGIGTHYANKLYTFRTKLGGFVSIDQVRECYGLQDSVYQRIVPFLTFKNATIHKLNINTASLEELDAHPYIAKWQAEDIVKNRPLYGINDLYELRTFKDKSKAQKLIPYLSF